MIDETTDLIKDFLKSSCLTMNSFATQVCKVPKQRKITSTNRNNTKRFRALPKHNRKHYYSGRVGKKAEIKNRDKNEEFFIDFLQK